MQTIVSYNDGRRTEFTVLSVGRFSMRVIAPGARDTMELTQSYGEWHDEAGQRIEFESLITGNEERELPIPETMALAGRSVQAVTEF